MKAELFVLPEKTRRDFMDAFVLTLEELELIGQIPQEVSDTVLWYDEACLWERMSPDLPRISLPEALDRLRAMSRTVLFLSDSPDGGDRGVFLFRGRPVTDFVAMADAGELADCIKSQWGDQPDGILPDTLYVFDTTFEWVMVFTEAMGCMAYGV